MPTTQTSKNSYGAPSLRVWLLDPGPRWPGCSRKLRPQTYKRGRCEAEEARPRRGWESSENAPGPGVQACLWPGAGADRAPLPDPTKANISDSCLVPYSVCTRLHTYVVAQRTGTIGEEN